MKIGGVAGPAEITRAIAKYQTNTAFNITRDAAGLPSVGATRVATPTISEVINGTGLASDKMSAVTLDISDAAKALNFTQRAALAAGQGIDNE